MTQLSLPLFGPEGPPQQPTPVVDEGRAPMAAPPVVMLPRELVLASAGSGKTFHITSRLIGLLSCGAPADEILASTFTRKAAAQILDRVLERLAGAALDPAAATTLGEEVGQDRSGTAAAPNPAQAATLGQEVRQDGSAAAASTDEWLRLLEAVARSLHRLNIGTLDAFFVRTARVFAHDLGLAPDWRIVDEGPTAGRLRADALHYVLAHADAEELVELVRTLEGGQATRSVHAALLSKVDGLLRIQHELDLAAPDPWNAFGTLYGSGGATSRAVGYGGPATLAGPRPSAAETTGPDATSFPRTRESLPGRDLRIPASAGTTDTGESSGDSEVAAVFTAQQRLIADAIASLPVPLTGAGKPSRRWTEALAKAADAVARGDWEAFLTGGVCAKILDDEPTYDRSAISAEVKAVFGRAIDAARFELGPRLAAQAAAMGRFSRAYADVLGQLQRDSGGYSFEDLTRLLGGPDAVVARPDLYYRLDARARHILLDEFQDTSVAQWEALEPLIDELLAGHAGERAAVIVADPKQSIYGWRGAEPDVVRHVGERYELESVARAQSYRSSQVVLDVVNRVFTDVAASPVFAGVRAAESAAGDWSRAFERHQAAHELPGYARIAVGPADEGQGPKRPRLCQWAARLLSELREQAPGHSIGVLTRTNWAVARMIYELRRLEIPVSEEGGNPLTDSPAVAAVLAAFRLADHPGDRVVRYHVAESPLGPVLRFDDHTDPGASARVAEQLRRRLLDDGYGHTLAWMVDRLSASSDARDRRRLMQLVERGFRYDEEATLRPADFVRTVEHERVEDPTTADVRVMTVHQAKGLEFDIVLLPELDTGLIRGNEVVLPFRPEPAGRVTAVYPPASKHICRLFPELQAAAEQARQSQIRDGLSGLYVGLTRARHALHIVIKPDGKRGGGEGMTAARIVREALVPGERAVAETSVLYEYGDRRWFEKLPDRRVAATTEPEPGPKGLVREGRDEGVVGMRETTRRRILARRTPSELEDGSRVDLRLLLRLDTSTARMRGSLVHAWFQRVSWIEDGLPAEAELRAIARRVAPAIDTSELSSLIEAFHAWVHTPSLSRLLTRAGYPASIRLEREMPFMHRDGDTLVEGVIDRLVLFSDGGQVVGAEIVDYKTGARLAERHPDELDGTGEPQAVEGRTGQSDVVAERTESDIETARTESAVTRRTGPGVQIGPSESGAEARPTEPDATARRIESDIEALAARYGPQLRAYQAAVAAMYGLTPDRVATRLAFVEAAVVV